MNREEIADQLTWLTPREREEIDLLLRGNYLELARRRILYFTTYTMPGFQRSWHHDLMADYLDRFASGEIKRLIISEPPRHTKSEFVSRRLPAFLLGQNPDAAIIAASYGAGLAKRMNRDVQRIMLEESYREVFPNTQLPRANVRASENTEYLRNSEMFEIVEYTGVYRGSGVGGSITGMGMNFGIIDDPLKKRKDANSPVIRQASWEWYTSTFRTRLAPGGGILITMTRWHEDDLVGRLLELQETDPDADQWELLTLPAVAEWSDKYPRPDYDPREEGEPLWPDRYDAEWMARTKASLGGDNGYDWNSLYQQRPRPPAGGMFPRDKFTIVAAAPYNADRVRYWDKAGSDGKGDWTVGVLMARATTGRFYVEDVVRGQWEAAERERIIRQVAELDSQRPTLSMRIWHEQEGGSGGKESAQATNRNLAGFNVYSEPVTGNKATRAEPFAAQVQGGNVDLVKGAWNARYIEELGGFPFAKNDDQVDASSGAFNKLSSVSTEKKKQSSSQATT